MTLREARKYIGDAVRCSDPRGIGIITTVEDGRVTMLYWPSEVELPVDPACLTLLSLDETRAAFAAADGTDG